MAASLEDPAPSPGSGTVLRQRSSRVELAEPAATPARLAAYLALVDRPVAALLARDRLQRPAPGRFVYRSRPFRLLRFELVPTLAFRAAWDGEALRLESQDCRLVGLGSWERLLAFRLAASLRPAGPALLEGTIRVSLDLPASLPGWGRSLAGRALDQVLARIERRLRRGLRKDLLTWMLDPAVSG